MKPTASDIREARLHTRDIIDVALAKFQANPKDPNVEVLLSKEDLDKLLTLIEVAEIYAEQKATARINQQIRRKRERGDIQ